MTIRIEGLDETIKAFDQLGASSKKHASDAITVILNQIRTDAVKLIQRGAKTGFVYVRGGGRNLSRTHRASAPGQAPATDTGNLVRSAQVKVKGLSGELSFTAPYAVHLEYGTMNMRERPFLRPSVDKNKSFAVTMMQRAVDKATQEFNK